MTRGPDIAALVASRLCHDLVNPLGAIGNGLELLALDHMAGSEEMALVTHSLADAQARLRFFRLAYGPAVPGTQISTEEIAAVLAAGLSPRFDCHWRATADPPRAEARIALLLVQCVETAMPRGGRIEMDFDGTDWTIAAAGRMSPDRRLWDGLRGDAPPADLRPAEVQFALLPGALAQAGRSLSLGFETDRVAARF